MKLDDIVDELVSDALDELVDRFPSISENDPNVVGLCVGHGLAFTIRRMQAAGIPDSAIARLLSAKE